MEDNEILRASEAEVTKLEKLQQATLLCKAAGANDSAAINYLLQAGFPPNVADYDSRTALHIASAEGHLEVVKALLANGASPNVKDRWGGTPMSEALRNKHSEVIEALKGAGADENEAFKIQLEMTSQLLKLIAEGDLEKVKTFLNQSPAELKLKDASDYDRRTPLHVAASEGKLAIVKYLVELGAGLNPVDRWGGTPLDDADRHKFTNVVKYLKEQGAESSNEKFDELSSSVLSLLTRLLQVNKLSKNKKKDITSLLEALAEKYPTQVEEKFATYNAAETATLKKYMKGHYPETNKELEGFVGAFVEKQIILGTK